MKKALMLLATAVLLYGCGSDPIEPTPVTPPEEIDPTIYVGIGCAGIVKENAKTVDYFKKCIEDAGGQMVCFENYATNDNKAKNDLNRVDALIIPGSSSADTTGRTACDKRLIGAAIAQGKPVLGICFGCQRINLMRGGKIDTVVKRFPDSPYDHYKGGAYLNHDVIIDKTSKLYQILKTEQIQVNSSHKYYCSQIPDGIRIIGTAPDGVTEAIEGTYPGDRLLGVQFHPEYLYALLGKDAFLAIFEDLVTQAREVKFAGK